jgi:hypothetical protein
MNHSCCHHTTATMIPHSWLQQVETLANMLCDKAMQLKLEYLIINNTYRADLCHDSNCTHIKEHRKY